MGALPESFAIAMRVWDEMKAAGASEDDRLEALERTLRAAWPQGRPWKYLCASCDDYGWVFRECTPGRRCGRPFRLPHAKGDDYTGRGTCGASHTYCVPCSCSKGREFAAQLEGKTSREPDLTTIGKTQRSGGFTRPGR